MGVGVDVGVGVAVGSGVAVGAGVAVGSGVAVGVCVAESASVGVGVPAVSSGDLAELQEASEATVSVRKSDRIRNLFLFICFPSWQRDSCLLLFEYTGILTQFPSKTKCVAAIIFLFLLKREMV